MKILCALGRYQYGRHELGEGIEYTAFIPALRRLGHEVVHFESWDRNRFRNFAELNAALFGFVCRDRPDVVLTVQRDCEIWTETLDAIKSLGSVTTITWATDDSWKYREVSRFIGRHYDAVATTYPALAARYKRDGIANVHVSQWAANQHWIREPRLSAQCEHDVSFIGAAYGRRREIIAALKERNVFVQCFGDGWPNGPVAADEIPEIINRSRVCLNFSDGFKHGSQRQIKARVFEVAGAGGLLLTEYALGLERFYQFGSEVLVYEGLDELESRIRWVLRNPEHRDSIALAGHVRTRGEHTYERRLSDLLAALFEERATISPARRTVNLSSAIERHRMNAALSLLRYLLTSVCGLIWRERGDRAARRALFEFSWRVLGARTFAACGLPGRLFPEL